MKTQFLMVVIAGAIIGALAALAVSDYNKLVYKRSLMEQCLKDGEKEYNCYRIVYGG